MGAELLAELRGITAVLWNYAGNPLVIFAIIFILYLFHRRSST
jgi:hypothetical protein